MIPAILVVRSESTDKISHKYSLPPTMSYVQISLSTFFYCYTRSIHGVFLSPLVFKSKLKLLGYRSNSNKSHEI